MHLAHARALNACAKYLQRGSGNQTTLNQALSHVTLPQTDVRDAYHESAFLAVPTRIRSAGTYNWPIQTCLITLIVATA